MVILLWVLRDEIISWSIAFQKCKNLFCRTFCSKVTATNAQGGGGGLDLPPLLILFFAGDSRGFEGAVCCILKLQKVGQCVSDTVYSSESG